MIRAAALLALAALPGCVAPEEPPVRRAPRPAAAQAAPADGPAFAPAPVANRGLKAPNAPPVLQVDGLTKK